MDRQLKMMKMHKNKKKVRQNFKQLKVMQDSYLR